MGHAAASTRKRHVTRTGKPGRRKTLWSMTGRAVEEEIERPTQETERAMRYSAKVRSSSDRRASRYEPSTSRRFSPVGSAEPGINRPLSSSIG